MRHDARRLLRQTAKSLALRISPIRRLAQDRDRLARENTALAHELRSAHEKTLFQFPGIHADAPCEAARPCRFLVTSWGHSGSIWFAGALNLHEELLCSVGIGHPIVGSLLYQLNRDLSHALRGDPSTLFEFGVLQGEDDFLARRGIRAGRIRDVSRIPWYLFDELSRIPGADRCAALGNIHGTTLSQLGEAYARDRAVLGTGPVVVMDLVRHPVPRTESAIKATMAHHLHALEAKISDYIARNSAECLALEKRYRIDFAEPRARASLHVFRQGLQNDVWAQEFHSFPRVPRLLFERLQQDADHFSWAVHTLSQGRVAADKSYLDRVFAPANLAAGRQSTKERVRPPGPADQYRHWSEWEQEEFARVAIRLNLRKTYLECGYDLSFVKTDVV